MTSKRSWLDLYLSPALVKENLKRFWGISAVGAFLLFLAGPYSVLLRYGDLGWQTVKRALSYPDNPTYIVLSALLPLVAAVAVFSYLNHTNSTTSLHAMPFSRSKLFWSTCLSGYLVAALPVLVNTLLLVCIQKNVYAPESVLGATASDLRINVYNGGVIFGNMGKQLLVMLFTFAICAIAATLCGNGVIHLLTSCALNVILPVLLVTLNAYGSIFLYGFSNELVGYNFIRLLHPLLYFVSGSVFGFAAVIEHGAVIAVFAYLAASVVLLAIGWALYRFRKMERAGESYVYKFFGYAVNFLLMYLFATLLGLLFIEFNRPLGIILGALLGFVVGRMIVCKSFRIFSRDTLKHFAIYAVILAVFVLGFVFDFFGVERYVPAPDSVAEVLVYTNAVNGEYSSQVRVSEPENVEAAEELHRSLAEHPEQHLADVHGGDFYSYVNIRYTLKSGRTVDREYDAIPASFVLQNEGFRKAFESEENRGKMVDVRSFDPAACAFSLSCDLKAQEFTLLGLDSVGNPALTGGVFREEQTAALRKELLETVARDIHEQDLARLSGGGSAVGTLYIEETHPYVTGVDDVTPERYDGRVSRYFDYENGQPVNVHLRVAIPLSDAYPHTVAWLQEQGLYDLLFPAEGEGFCLIAATQDRCYDAYYSVEAHLERGPNGVPMSADDVLVLSGAEELRAVAESMYGRQLDEKTAPAGYALFFCNMGAGYQGYGDKSSGDWDIAQVSGNNYQETWSGSLNVSALPQSLRARVERVLAQ